MSSILRRVRDGFKVRAACRQIRRHGFWFVDIPRTSSSSIRAELTSHFGNVHGKLKLFEEEYAAESVFPGHQPARKMRHVLGDSAWRDIFTFTVVRNPWDRAVSLFAYRRRVGDIPGEWTFREYVRRLAEADSTTEGFKYYGYRWGASDFIVDDDGQIIVDYVARFETRSDDLKVIGGRIGLDRLGDLAIQGTSQGLHYGQSYDSETADVIRNLYRRDIELFGYEFEPEP